MLLCLATRLWGTRDNETVEYKKYFKFVEAVANVTYSSLEIFKEFKGDKDFKNVDMLDIADKVLFFVAPGK